MAHKQLIFALSMIVAVTPAAASLQSVPVGAPPGGPNTQYCMRVEPFTGSRIETIQCWTRQEWADQGVDVDKDWAENGVRVLA